MPAPKAFACHASKFIDRRLSCAAILKHFSGPTDFLKMQPNYADLDT
jgi:hypothetical protein